MSIDIKENSVVQLVSFTLADECYGIDIHSVKEIIRIQRITKIPHAPDFVEGVLNLRGNIIPILDLRKRFSLKISEYSNDSRIIVVEIGSTVIGFVVDRVSQVIRLSRDSIEATPSIVTGIGKEYLKGVGKLDDKLIIFLDINKLLSLDEHENLKSVSDIESDQ